MISRIYSQKLIEAGFEVAVAADGLEAMKRLPGFRPDLVVLDLLMPRMTGPEVLKFMRQHQDLKSTRVIVFSNSFLSNLVDMVASMGVESALVKSAVTPARLIDEIRKVLQGPAHANANPPETTASASVPARRPHPAEAAAEPKPVAAGPKPARPSEPEGVAGPESDKEFLERIGRQFLERSPILFNDLRELCRGFLGAADSAAQADALGALNRKLGFLTQISGMAGYQRTAALASALEALIFELVSKPALLNDSSRRTIASTIALLARSFDDPARVPERDLPHVAILVVDDDPISNRAVVDALARGRLTARSVTDPQEAWKQLQHTAYDIVLLDIVMPGMDGLSLCEQMRSQPPNQRTPVIFVTGHDDFPTRVRSILSGGDDLIAKPIFPTELCVKVLAHLLKAN